MRPSRGFTLIELLVVLALFGLAGSLVAPDLWKAYEGASERNRVIEMGRELMDHRREGYYGGRTVTFAKDELSARAVHELPFTLSPGWIVKGNSSLQFLPTGVTAGGSVLFVSSTGRAWRLTVSDFDGQLDVEPG